MSVLEYIGRFHPALVHFPIGILLAAAFLEFLSHFKGFRKVRKSVKILLLLGFISAFFDRFFLLFPYRRFEIIDTIRNTGTKVASENNQNYHRT